MKKKQISFKTIAAYVLGLAILAIIGFNVHLVMESQKKLTDSDVTLKNIEALSEENNEPSGYEEATKDNVEPESICMNGTRYNCMKIIVYCSGVGNKPCTPGFQYDQCVSNGVCNIPD